MAAAVNPASLMAYKVGTQMTLTTSGGQEVSGELFASDADTDFLVVKEPGSHGGVSTLRFIKASTVSGLVKMVEPEPAQPGGTGPLPVVDAERSKARKEKSMRQAAMDAARIGDGVTKEAQAICDALSKTMPVRWQDKTIVVLEEVSIDSPYGVDNCRVDNLKDHKSALERVKKVLQAERQRLDNGSGAANGSSS